MNNEQANTGAPAALTPAPSYAAELDEWRDLMVQRPGLTPEDVAELEDHLLTEVEALQTAGLRADEAFLIAVKRLGSQNDLAREYSQVHSERLWRHLVLSGATGASNTGAPGAPGSGPRTHIGTWDLPLAIGLGALAGLAVRLPYEWLSDNIDVFYMRYLALLIVPFIAAYLVGRRFLVAADRAHATANGPSAPAEPPMDRIGLALMAAIIMASAILVTLYPSDIMSMSFVLTAIHLPITLLTGLGLAYLGPRWRSARAWMDWVRFLGEAMIYYVLIALGGGVLVGIIVALFSAIDVSPDVVERTLTWVVPICAAGAVLVCAWLVERKKSVMENMAPVLTAVFTPILTIALAVIFIAVVATGGPVALDREILISFDAVLVIVTAIVVFTVSARPLESGPRTLDWLQVWLIVAAVAVDVLMLWAMGGRLAEYGASPNKLAALGANVVLLVHLLGSLWLYLDILKRGATARNLVRWQGVALPVFATWAAIVAFVFPPLFTFV